MRLSDIGERNAIKKIISHFPQDVEVGIGDDCAAIKIGKKLVLITTDMISEKTHIPPGATGFQVGWFVTAINLSDIAAKGGQPMGLTLAMGVPRSYDLEFLENVARGANMCARTYGVTIMGGDTKEADAPVFMGTAVGVVNQELFMSRRGAKNGDIVCVTGTLGRAGAGLYVLRENSGDDKMATKEILEVSPRIPEGMALGALGCVTSSMDISDGVASCLYQLQEVNNVGFRVYEDKIPLSPYAKRTSGGKWEREKNWAFYSGGDYELLCTIKKEKVSLARDRVASVGGILSPIGEVISKQDILLVDREGEKILDDKGFEHFINK